MIFTSWVLIGDSAVYSVVVLPEPVGPVTSRMPCGFSSTSTKRCWKLSVKPSEAKSNTTDSRSRMRITTDSPKLVGTVDKRRSEEHTSELQSLMRISYAVFCLKKKKKPN